MALEIIEEPTGSATGTFTPYANQKTHRSAFGVIEGNGKAPGFLDARTLENGIVSGDGRRKLRYKPFQDESKKYHDITFNGQKLREFICEADDARAMDLYSAGVSNERVAGFLAPVNVASSATQVGIQREGSISEVQVPSTHQF